jgi:hypothetical protein
MGVRLDGIGMIGREMVATGRYRFRILGERMCSGSWSAGWRAEPSELSR